MSTANFEQRLDALEATVEQLKSQLATTSASSSNSTPQELLPGVEYPFVVAAPLRPARQLRGRIVGVRRAPQALGMSTSEWAALVSEPNDV